MEGVLPPLRSAQQGRPPCRTIHPRSLCVYLERGHGAGRTEGGQTARGKKEGRNSAEGKKVGVEEGASLSTEVSNREEEEGSGRRGEERRGEEREKQTNKASSSLTLLSSPLLSVFLHLMPCSPPLSPPALRRLLRLTPFLPANYIIYAVASSADRNRGILESRTEMQQRGRLFRDVRYAPYPQLTQDSIEDGWRVAKRALFVNDRSRSLACSLRNRDHVRVRSFVVRSSRRPIDCDRPLKRPKEVTASGVSAPPPLRDHRLGLVGEVRLLPDRFNSIGRVLQGQSLTVTPLTVTVGYSDTFSDSQTITNDFHAVTVTNMLLE